MHKIIVHSRWMFWYDFCIYIYIKFFHEYEKHCLMIISTQWGCVLYGINHIRQKKKYNHDRKKGRLLPCKLIFRNSRIIFFLKQYTIEIVWIIRMLNPRYQTFIWEQIRKYFEKRLCEKLRLHFWIVSKHFENTCILICRKWRWTLHEDISKYNSIQVALFFGI